MTLSASVRFSDCETFERARQVMVERELQCGNSAGDVRVQRAMARLPREAFVPASLRRFAYFDQPLPIGFAQTMSQPSVTAWLLNLARLTGAERVLDVGTGSGYQAALLGVLAESVTTVEIIAELFQRALGNLQAAGSANVRSLHGDGLAGCTPGAPYDVIVLSSATPNIPGCLVDQLAVGGRLVLPVGPPASLQAVLRITRQSAARVLTEELGSHVFEPVVASKLEPHLFA